MNDADLETLWKFVRGDLPASEFEKWLYASSDFEKDAGNEFYLEIISTNFNAKPEVYVLKQRLNTFMRRKFPLDCECMALSNDAVTDMGSKQEERIWETLELVKKYGESRWWLGLCQCNKCEQYWLMAQESRQNDIHCFKRLKKIEIEKIIQDNVWPKSFETLEELFAIGRDKKCSVRFVEKFSPALISSVKDLQEARHDITISEIASLLNIDEIHVAQICDKIADFK